MEGITINIENVSIYDLIDYNDNPRNNDEAVDYVKASIKEFGFKVPIVVDSDYTIIAGHTRKKAALEIGIKEVPVIVANDLTPEQVNAFRLADNKVAEFSQWDEDLLMSELNLLDDIDMGDFGFDLDDSIEDVEVEEDDFDEEPPGDPVSKVGQIYQLGRHRLMCGDSTDEDNIKKLMDDNKANMIYTDPPYGIDLDTDYTSAGSNWGKQKSLTKSKKYEKVLGDASYYDVKHIFRDFDYVKEIFLWGANYFARDLPNLEKSSWVVWDKTGYHSQQVIGSEFELLWSKQKHKQIIISYKWAGVIGLSQQDMKKRVHPTQKPLQVIMPILEKYSFENDIIVDLFGGSGSTLMACEQTGRNAYLMELDPKYVDVIISRWEQYTGEEAVLIDGKGQSVDGVEETKVK